MSYVPARLSDPNQQYWPVPGSTGPGGGGLTYMPAPGSIEYNQAHGIPLAQAGGWSSPYGVSAGSGGGYAQTYQQQPTRREWMGPLDQAAANPFNTNSQSDGSMAIYPWMGQHATNAPWSNAQTTQIGRFLGGIPLGGQGGGGGGGMGQMPGGFNINLPLTTGTMGLTPGMFGAADDGRRDFVHDDFVNAALTRLASVHRGEALPFDETTKSNMLSQASDMSAAAAQQQADSIKQAAAMGGASLSDPSVQAAMRELDSRRQGQNIQAAQAIESQANLHNFDARQTANNQMAALRFDQRSRSPVGVQPAPGGQATYQGGMQPGAQPGGQPARTGPTGPWYNPAQRAQSYYAAINSRQINGTQNATWNPNNNTWSQGGGGLQQGTALMNSAYPRAGGGGGGLVSTQMQVGAGGGMRRPGAMTDDDVTAWNDRRFRMPGHTGAPPGMSGGMYRPGSRA